MEWTLKHAGTTQSLQEWGFENCVITDKGWVPSTFQFTHSGAAFDAAPIFGKDDEITLYLDGVKKFVGFITQIPARIGGGEQQSYLAENLLGDLARRVMGQVWRHLFGGSMGDGINARAVLFDGLNVSSSLQSIVEAAAAAGVSVQMGTAENLTISPRKIDVKSATFLEALRAACIYSKDVVPQVDYLTDPPTLNFIRRGDAIAHDLPVIDAAESFDISPNYDQQISGVYLVYETSGTLDGKPRLSLNYDVYPPGTLPTGRRVLFNVESLQGAMQPSAAPAAQTTVQEITVATVDEEDIEWWKLRVPYLRSASEGSILTDITVKDEEGADDTVAKELRSGVIYPWMGGTTKTVVLTAVFNGLIEGQPVLNQKITITLVSTTLGSGEYQNTVYPSPDLTDLEATPAETPPVGLAEHLYGALSVLHWSGSRVLIEEECPANIRAGDVANFPGTDNEAWNDLRAHIQAVEMNLDMGTTRIEFGRPEYLSPADFLDLIRESRKLTDGNSSSLKNSGGSSGSTVTSEGPNWTPNTSVILGKPEEVHPWKLSRVGLTGNLFRLQGGTYMGTPIEAETVDIGSTRPLHVYISAGWRVTTWADRIAATVLRTTSPATIASSTAATSTTMAIPSGTTTVKHLLATVAAGDFISQWENTNLAPVWKPSSGLDGSALLDHYRV
jgi:hypothetical protein